MSERYSDLYSLPERLYTEGAPVIISAGSLLRDNETGRIAVQLELKSISLSIITAVMVKIVPLDSAQNPLGQIYQEYIYLDVERDEEFGKNFHIAVPNDATQTFTAEVTEVDFADGSIWDMSGTAWEPLPALEPVGDPELVKQYQMRFGKKAQYKPVVYKGIWQCACGGINNEKGYFCHKCGNKKADLLACDLEELAAARDQRLAEEKAAAEAKAKKKRILAIGISAAVLCIGAVLLLTKVIIPNYKYNQVADEAAALLEAGDYEGVIALYQEIGYSQNDVSIPGTGMEALYVQAEKFTEEGKYFEAAIAHTRIIGGSNSYNTIQQLSMSEEYVPAMRTFVEINNLTLSDYARMGTRDIIKIKGTDYDTYEVEGGSGLYYGDGLFFTYASAPTPDSSNYSIVDVSANTPCQITEDLYFPMNLDEIQAYADENDLDLRLYYFADEFGLWHEYWGATLELETGRVEYEWLYSEYEGPPDQVYLRSTEKRITPVFDIANADSEPPASKVMVKADVVNVRAYASTNAEVLDLVKHGNIITYLGYAYANDNGDLWYHVELPNGKTGYIASWLCDEPY